mmetsp:Transcript_16265/g.27504  ORF Transcript_16265/g.27504 Transcript_16265/m.27504 type:complete len:258 (-) Transcript_16265:168-941(-)|eukprot:CAMPEP_0168608040 /NCGR_PEP_ID=MMETSP0449_2-20121227/404_1 /TAXON_ID=1082188 /ORGANISM="Strombidium rassoulzadegani, Strain ras09" /LENGTH=257 /DNA_ID=CAMNT_0008647977 /DNA_START=28 /DNA_END=801 /DNA_ORIENTATION=+
MGSAAVATTATTANTATLARPVAQQRGLRPAPSAHTQARHMMAQKSNMMNRAAVKAQASSTTTVERSAAKEVSIPSKDPIYSISDVGDRVPHPVQYSDYREEEGTIRREKGLMVADMGDRPANWDVEYSEYKPTFNGYPKKKVSSYTKPAISKTELVMGVADVGDRPAHWEAEYSTFMESEHRPGWYQDHQNNASFQKKINDAYKGSCQYTSKFEAKNRYTNLHETKFSPLMEDDWAVKSAQNIKFDSNAVKNAFKM